MHQSGSGALADVGATYRALELDGEGMAELRRIGAEATERARAGDLPFGPSANVVKSVSDARLALAQAQHLHDVDADTRVDRLLRSVASTGQTRRAVLWR